MNCADIKSYSGHDCKGNSIDMKLDQIINKENGFFIELGGFDGLYQSNTAMFEFYKNWKGIIIEPSYDNYMKCIENRKNSICLNYACVDNDYKDEHIYGDFNNNIMASVNGMRINNNNLISVKAITLEKILDQYKDKDIEIDFLSLDTEGYEFKILQGLNLSKYRPKFMLIEIYNYDFNNIVSYLHEYKYKLYSNFTNFNIIDNPRWDGTHNDYLFISFEHLDTMDTK